MCEQLSLIEQEEDVLVLEEEEVITPHQSEKRLLLKLLSSKYFNKEAFKNSIKRVWHPNKALSIRDISTNLFLAEFEDNRDKERVKHDDPWAFDEHLVLTKDVLSKSTSPSLRQTSGYEFMIS
ncbi:unnamed protein product [Fraxinus pennsylvanica]|uniref:DUF4283 domain-containing protein n=1 Tax=Fraxinus pennsylvanica TaxID=56036 RepID=A0AAD2AC55_9LAMI|nr:unnamed protein product [Fraxinus pennsylvanica]